MRVQVVGHAIPMCSCTRQVCGRGRGRGRGREHAEQAPNQHKHTLARLHTRPPPRRARSSRTPPPQPPHPVYGHTWGWGWVSVEVWGMGGGGAVLAIRGARPSLPTPKRARSSSTRPSHPTRTACILLYYCAAVHTVVHTVMHCAVVHTYSNTISQHTAHPRRALPSSTRPSQPTQHCMHITVLLCCSTYSSAYSASLCSRTYIQS